MGNPAGDPTPEAAARRLAAVQELHYDTVEERIKAIADALWVSDEALVAIISIFQEHLRETSRATP